MLLVFLAEIVCADMIDVDDVPVVPRNERGGEGADLHADELSDVQIAQNFARLSVTNGLLPAHSRNISEPGRRQP